MRRLCLGLGNRQVKSVQKYMSSTVPCVVRCVFVAPMYDKIIKAVFTHVCQACLASVHIVSSYVTEFSNRSIA